MKTRLPEKLLAALLAAMAAGTAQAGYDTVGALDTVPAGETYTLTPGVVSESASSPNAMAGEGVLQIASTGTMKAPLYVHAGQRLLWRDPLADAVQAANWGVFRSSQAFANMLHSNRPNAVRLNTPIGIVQDGKNAWYIMSAGDSYAWASGYGQFARQSSSGHFGGADYSIYGAAMGLEHHFFGGSTIGLAFGYDWGRVSPFRFARVDQQSMHAALYGRLGLWNVTQNGTLAFDWSAIVGNTSSDFPMSGSDLSQDNLQLDFRALYNHRVTAHTWVSAFAGVQYYAQNDDSNARVHADSLQNMRLIVGMGVQHRLSERTRLFGEMSFYHDAMRHNPHVRLDGFEYGSGANPGRIGGNVMVGGEYAFSDSWSMRAGYSFDVAKDSIEHNVNLGATYKF